MKKILLSNMLLICTMILIACGNKSDTVGSEKNHSESESIVIDSESEIESESEVDEEDSILEGTYKVPMEEIYIDIPKDYQGIEYKNVESGRTEIYNIGYELNICITTERTEKVSTIEEANEKSFEKYKIGVNSYLNITELKIENEEYMEVNGIPVYRFEGQLIGDDGEELYTVGYAFSMNGIPCRIQGMVLCQDEDCSNAIVHEGDMDEEIRTTVDAMIQTLRSEP